MSVAQTGTPSRLERWKTRYEHYMDTRSASFAVWLLRATRGRIVRLWRRRAMVLTTRGRKSGLSREVPIQYFPDGDSVVIVGANSGMDRPPAWYLNLSADPRVIIEVEGRRQRALAHELSEQEAEAFWPRVLAQAPDYDRYRRRTSRRLPLVRLTPVAGGASGETPGDGAPVQTAATEA
jgi:deazaflavin-dependent oxidoreductase (nitroreductase family)